MKKLSQGKKNKKYGWLIFILIFYIAVKCVINPEPLISISNSTLKIGLFNFYKKPFAVEPEYQFAIRPLIQISAYHTDLTGNHPLKPFSNADQHGVRHWLGTDKLGRDVLAGFIGGFELALIISLSVGILSGLITVLAGAMGAYYRRYPKKTTKLRRFILVICLVKFVFLSTWYLLGIYSIVPFIMFTLILLGAVILILKLPIKSNNVNVTIPISSFNRRFLEFFQPIPDLIFLMLFALLFDQMGLTGLIFILIILRIPYGSYYLQGLADQFVHKQHIDQAKSMGLSSMRIVFQHLIPLMIPGTAVFMVLSASRAVLSESALAFLGIGPTGDYITWGSMIRLGLTNLDMWWVSFFPILGLVLLSLVYQKMAKAFQKVQAK